MISQKDINILSYLFEMSEKQQYVSVEELAQKFEVSNRTIRYDLDKIDDYLKENALPKLSRDRKNGIFLDLAADEIAGIRRNFQELGANTYVFSREERVLYLQLLLFDTDDYLTYEDLSGILFISRKTVIEDVRSVKEECERWGIQVAGTKYGIRFTAPELLLRQMLLDRMLNRFTPLELWQVLRGIYPNKSVLIEKKWREVAGGGHLPLCGEILRTCEQKELYTVSDAQYCLVLILTVLAIKRHALGKRAQAAQAPSETRPYLRSYFEELEKLDAFAMPQTEQAYVLSELDRIFHQLNPERVENLSSALLESFIIRISERTKTRYYNDVELCISLQKHFMALIENGYIGYETSRAVVKSIVQEAPGLYRSVRETLCEFEQLRDATDLEVESALVLLHLLAADERRNTRLHTDHSALVVCHNGVGTAKIVSARIKKRFPQLRIAATTAVRDVDSQIRAEKPDLIIATIPFEHPEVPVVKVNTLTTEEDLERVQACLQESGGAGGELPERPPYEQVMDAVGKTCDIRDGEKLEAELRRIFHMEEASGDLLDSLGEEDILVGLDATDWEQAIRKSAQPLLKSCVTPRYLDAMVENVKVMGPYIVITKGIALPHAVASDGVARSGISLATLRSPVEFGNKYNDPVRLVICIAAVNKKEHMREMSRLINLISSERFVDEICAAADARQVLETIRRIDANHTS